MKNSYSRSGSSHLGERKQTRKTNPKSLVLIVIPIEKETNYVQSFQRKRIALTDNREYAKKYEFNEALKLIAASGLQAHQYILVRPD